MDLLCTEGSQPKRAYYDAVYMKDDRVIENLLKLEEHYQITRHFIEHQKDIKPYMRRVVTQWMCEVCEEQKCEEEVFSLSVHFMDRFLSHTSDIKRNRLQLLATACMFLASKLKDTYPMSAEKLVIYTDYSITLRQLMDWEMLVLAKLRWDVGSITATDFLDVFLERLSLSCEVADHTRRLSLAYIRLSSLDHACSSYPQSMLAAACILTALQPNLNAWRSSTYAHTLNKITGIELEVLLSCQEYIHQTTGSTTGSSLPLSTVKRGQNSQPGTPTEVMEVVVS